MAHALERIIGVDQEDRLGVERRERPERLHLVLRRLNEAVRHGARHGHAVDLAGERVRGRCHAGDVERPRRLDRCVDAVHAARAEVDHAAARGRRYDACGLGGENRLQMYLVHDESLGELCLRDRRSHLQNWLVLEHGRALGHGIDVAGEAESLQPLQKALGEAAERGKVIQALAGEAQALEVSEHVVEAAGEEVVAPLGQAPHEEAEGGLFVHALLDVCLQHRELVEIGEQAEVGVVDPESSVPPSASPPSRDICAAFPLAMQEADRLK